MLISCIYSKHVSSAPGMNQGPHFQTTNVMVQYEILETIADYIYDTQKCPRSLIFQHIHQKISKMPTKM